MKKDLLTIAEYAAIKGITTQAVYKQVDKNLKQFVVMVDNKKYIKRAALHIENQPNKQPVVQPCNQPVAQPNEKLIDTLQLTIEVLKEQLKEKDNQINALNEQLTKALDTTNKALETTSQANYITAAATLAPGQDTGNTDRHPERQPEPKQTILEYLKNKFIR